MSTDWAREKTYRCVKSLQNLGATNVLSFNKHTHTHTHTQTHTHKHTHIHTNKQTHTQEAVEAVMGILGMHACEGTEAVPPNARSHTVLLSGMLVGHQQVCVCVCLCVCQTCQCRCWCA